MSRVLMVERIADLTNRDLDVLCGTVTVARGLAYARDGHVLDVSTEADGAEATGWVAGSNGETYVATIALRPGKPLAPGRRAPMHWNSTCTCPMRTDCKHTVAVAVRVRTLDPPPATTHRSTQNWERALGSILEEDDDSEFTPLALLLEPVTPSSRRNSWTIEEQSPTLRLRPLVPGAQNGWIRTGVSWESFAGGYYGYGRMIFEDGQRDALTALADAHRRSVRAYGYGRMPDSVLITQLGPQWCQLLRAAARAGVHLITHPKRADEVHFAVEPAGFVVEVSRTPDGAELRPRLDLPPEAPVDGTTLVGTPATGWFAWDGPTLLLGALNEPLDAAKQRLLDIGTIEVPEEDWPRFTLTHLPGLRRRAEVRSLSPDLELPDAVRPRLALTATFEEGHRVLVDWTFRYGDGTGAVDVPLLTDGHDPMRDRSAEHALLERAAAIPELAEFDALWTTMGRTRSLIPTLRLHQFDTVALTEVLAVLAEHPDLEVSVRGEPTAYSESVEVPLISVSATDAPDGEGSDWFDLGVSVTVGGEDVPLAPLIEALAQGHERLILDSGTWFSLDRPELEALRALLEEARAIQDRPTDPLRISIVHAGLWEELVGLGVVDRQSSRWQRSVGALLNLEDRVEAEVPAGLAATLRPYQVEGFQWLSLLWDAGLGGVLADDMGLGKTLQMLAMAVRAHERGELEEPLLVVAPTSVLATWEGEVARFAPGLRAVVLGRTRAKDRRDLDEAIEGAQIVITSYAVVRLDEDVFRSRTWGAVVLDEAQFVKNHQAKTYQVVRRLSARAKFAITGTPLENSLMDLWSLLSIVAPGLYPKPQGFRDQWAKPIESGRSPELLATLRRRIRPLMLRRTKGAVAADLPPKQEQVLSVALHPRHRAVYDRHLQRERQRLLGLIEDLDGNRIAILRALTVLRQLALDPVLVDPEAYAGLGQSAKVDALVEQLVELAAEGHRALVFSQFTGFLALVRARLESEGIGYSYLDGRTRDRAARIAGFREGDDPVFLISLKAGGFGLTLTEADYVFVLDPWWNPAAENQAIDRTHRIGQTKPVNVYRLVSTNTIEEKVVALQDKKRDLFARVVDDGAMLSSTLTAADLRALLDH